MTYAVHFNTTDSPVVIDDDGRAIAGGTWAPARTTSPQVTDAVVAGRLVEVAKPDGDDVNPAAAEAFAEVDRLNTTTTSSRRRPASSSDSEED